MRRVLGRGRQGKIFPAVRPKAWHMGRDATYEGAGEGRTIPGAQDCKKRRLKPVTAPAATEACDTLDTPCGLASLLVSQVYTERWEIWMD